jgi:hypothetical protein
VSSHGKHIRLLAFALPPAPAPDSLSSPTFSQLIDSPLAWSSWSVKELALPSDLGALLSALCSGSARAVSDGSFKDKFATSSAFTIVASLICSILGMNVVPGHPDDQSTYRSELAGLIVLLVILLCSWSGILSGAIEIGCDGLSALSKSFDSWHLEPANPHFDMLSSFDDCL